MYDLSINVLCVNRQPFFSKSNILENMGKKSRVTVAAKAAPKTKATSSVKAAPKPASVKAPKRINSDNGALVALAPQESPPSKQLRRQDTELAAMDLIASRFRHVPPERLSSAVDKDGVALLDYVSDSLRHNRAENKRCNTQFWSDVEERFALTTVGSQSLPPADPNETASNTFLDALSTATSKSNQLS